MEEDTKTCPRCAETIKSKAVVCRFCGYDYVNLPPVPQSPKLVASSGPRLNSFESCLGCLGIALASLFVLAIVGSLLGSKNVDSPANTAASESAPPEPAALKTTGSASNLPRFDPVKVEAMKKQLLDEPKIVDLLFQEEGEVEWQVAVVDDGTSRVGYAGYVCLLLQEKGLSDEKTDVRVVDIAKINQGIGFRSASLGHYDCTTGEDLGV